ncbi:MAG: SIMPL domain-containing protein [Scytolyngbya sp. HA4215-MV1]|nr:SIMPL domain-containing protein [Scytolyngbya sp. HA4215-MV1]
MGKSLILPLFATIALSNGLGGAITQPGFAQSQPAPPSTPPSREEPLQLGQPNTGLSPQLITPQRAVTIIGQGQVTAPADIAQLEFTLGSQTDFSDKTSANSPLSIEDKRQAIETAMQPIVNALLELQITKSDLTLQTNALESPKLRVQINKPTQERLQQIVSVVDRAAKANRQFFVQSIGAAYSINNCQPLERVARRLAINDAQTQIKILAIDLNVSLGELLFATAFPLSGSPAAFSNCGSKVSTPAPNLIVPDENTFPPYSPSDPIEVKVRSQMSLTYTIQSR